MANQVENHFLVALEGVKLTDAQKAKINVGFQEVVMKELANIDHSEGILVKKHSVKVPTSIGDIPFIWGIRIRELNGQVILERQQLQVK